MPPKLRPRPARLEPQSSVIVKPKASRKAAGQPKIAAPSKQHRVAKSSRQSQAPAGKRRPSSKPFQSRSKGTPATSRRNLPREAATRGQERSIRLSGSKLPRKAKAIQESQAEPEASAGAVETVEFDDPKLKHPISYTLPPLATPVFQTYPGYQREESFGPQWKAQYSATLREIYGANLFDEDEDEEDIMSHRSTNRGTSATDNASETINKRKAGLTGEEMTEGLIRRSVITKEARDPYFDVMMSKLQHLKSPRYSADVEKHWSADLKKCGISHEALFQHTIMMELLGRHSLSEKLDYACEALWKSVPPPNLADLRLPRPKSDLLIGFRCDALVKDDYSMPWLGGLLKHMLPEETQVEGDARAFPFFILEAKGKIADEEKALRQLLNTASLALFNIWKFVKGKKPEQDDFFKQVRVFTAIGHSKGFSIRMHWAKSLLNHPAGRYAAGDALAYHHQKIVSVSDDSQYTRAKVVGSIGNILKYGDKTLFPILESAVAKTIFQVLGIPDTPTLLATYLKTGQLPEIQQAPTERLSLETEAGQQESVTTGGRKRAITAPDQGGRARATRQKHGRGAGNTSGNSSFNNHFEYLEVSSSELRSQQIGDL